MEWEQKVKLIQLGNTMNNGEDNLDDRKKFHEFVLEHISNFDGQAWDMFANTVEIIVDDMKKENEFWKSVYQHLKGVDCNDKKFGFRSAMRIALIQTVCEERLGLK